eukprot:COSAG05_NODE_16963_length_335_cov_0.317797_1_plen_56_part_01
MKPVNQGTRTHFFVAVGASVFFANDHPSTDAEFVVSMATFFKQKTAYEILRSDWSS